MSRPFERAVEDNVRMILGQQHMVFNPFFGRYINVAEWMTDKDRNYRQRATINRTLYWYMLTMARMTENQFIAGYQPATADHNDAMLAQVADGVAKHIWRKGHLDDVHEQLMAWVCAAGRAYLCVRLDPTKGDLEPWVGPAVLSMEGPDGQMIERFIEEVPYQADGTPAAQLVSPDEFSIAGKPHVEREGELAFDILSPLQVRGEWAPNAWYKKRWHAWTSVMHVDEVEGMWGAQVEPSGSPESVTKALELRRLLYGSGFFDATSAHPGADSALIHVGKDTTPVYTYVCAPSPAYEETPDSAGGRMIVCTPTRVLYDGPRPVRWPYTSPVHAFGFVRTPGRQVETTPLEALKPLQRVYNRGATQILRHRDLQSNPQKIIDSGSGINVKSVTNEPGQNIVANRRSNIPPIDFLQPPSLPSDVWRIQEWLKAEMQDIGNIEGAEGRVPTSDASGELVNQLRFNADRYLGPSLRRTAGEYGRVIETCFSYVPVMWTREKIITVNGIDNAATTMTVLPDLFDNGRVNVVPDLESMMPESRGERRARIEKYFMLGAFGMPQDPIAIMRFLELVNFPHVGRLAVPGGIDGVTAQQENAKLIQGVPADQIPTYEWYDHQVHVHVHERFMKSPEFLALDPQRQFAFVQHWQIDKMYMQAKLLQDAQTQGILSQLSGQSAEKGQKAGTATLEGAIDEPAMPQMPEMSGMPAQPGPPQLPAAEVA